jgi:Zn-dependent M28 family amino/carboxypeptidase
MGPLKLKNVIATIKGSEFPDEIVMFGGHLDSYCVSTGAIDNATGIANVMEAARWIATTMKETGVRPKRTIKFCLWTFEEGAIAGSYHWVENNKDKWGNIVNYFNQDGGHGVDNSLTVPHSWVEDMKKIVAPVNMFNPEFPIEIIGSPAMPRPARIGGSDWSSFAIRGIPALRFEEDDVRGYNTDYYEIWHSERDTYDQVIPVYVNHNSVVYAITLWGIANLPRRLPAKDVFSN